MGLKVKNTYLSKLRKSDISMYAGIIPNLDVLGGIITLGEGNKEGLWNIKSNTPICPSCKNATF